jgi:hypothetical protein
MYFRDLVEPGVGKQDEQAALHIVWPTEYVTVWIACSGLQSPAVPSHGVSEAISWDLSAPS